MKATLKLISFFCLIQGYLFAQVPEKMSYQAVIRNATNDLLSNQTVGMRVSLLQGSTTGTIIFSETHTTNTNLNGLVSIEIGAGNILSGDFTTIDWANGPYYVQTETDLTGGTNYSLTQTTQMMSVPYALYAKTAGNSSDTWMVDNDTTYTMNRIVVKGQDPNYYTVGTTNLPAAISYTGNDAVPVIIKRSPNTVFNTSFGASNVVGTALFGINNAGQACIGFNADQTNAALRVVGSISDPNCSLILKPSNTAPVAPVKGQMYFDSITNKLMVFDGTIWQACW